jgi:hypothetical protein
MNDYCNLISRSKSGNASDAIVRIDKQHELRKTEERATQNK